MHIQRVPRSNLIIHQNRTRGIWMQVRGFKRLRRRAPFCAAPPAQQVKRQASLKEEVRRRRRPTTCLPWLNRTGSLTSLARFE